MIQELLGVGGAGLLGGDQMKMVAPVQTSATTATQAAPPTQPPPPADQQNLRCPRCDSSNTKFCYYNNYNLTQPRHFCKTCRRYWTKGGALRNVPIGGGCRKSKSNIVSCPNGKPGGGKPRLSPADFIKSPLGFDHDLYHQHQQASNPNPMLWASPQNSHLLALLRSTPNPNPNSMSMSIKDEALDARPMSVDPLSMWRNPNPQQQQNQNLFLGDHVQHSGGMQELYQRLRSSVHYYNGNNGNDHNQAGMFSNIPPTSTTTTSAMLDPLPITSGGEMGYWSPMSWPSVSATATNGAYQ